MTTPAAPGTTTTTGIKATSGVTPTAEKGTTKSFSVGATSRVATIAAPGTKTTTETAATSVVMTGATKTTSTLPRVGATTAASNKATRTGQNATRSITTTVLNGKTATTEESITQEMTSTVSTNKIATKATQETTTTTQSTTPGVGVTTGVTTTEASDTATTRVSTVTPRVTFTTSEEKDASAITTTAAPGITTTTGAETTPGVPTAAEGTSKSSGVGATSRVAITAMLSTTTTPTTTGVTTTAMLSTTTKLTTPGVTTTTEKGTTESPDVGATSRVATTAILSTTSKPLTTGVTTTSEEGTSKFPGVTTSRVVTTAMLSTTTEPTTTGLTSTAILSTTTKPTTTGVTSTAEKDASKSSGVATSRVATTAMLSTTTKPTTPGVTTTAEKGTSKSSGVATTAILSTTTTPTTTGVTTTTEKGTTESPDVGATSRVATTGMLSTTTKPTTTGVITTTEKGTSKSFGVTKYRVVTTAMLSTATKPTTPAVTTTSEKGTSKSSGVGGVGATSTVATTAMPSTTTKPTTTGVTSTAEKGTSKSPGVTTSRVATTAMLSTTTKPTTNRVTSAAMLITTTKPTTTAVTTTAEKGTSKSSGVATTAMLSTTIKPTTTAVTTTEKGTSKSPGVAASSVVTTAMLSTTTTPTTTGVTSMAEKGTSESAGVATSRVATTAAPGSTSTSKLVATPVLTTMAEKETTTTRGVGTATLPLASSYASLPTAAAQCPILTAPAHGTISSTEAYYYQDVVTFTCDAGYKLNGVFNVSCQVGGMWSHPIPTCTDIDECTMSVNALCGVNAHCINTDGSFLCVCDVGYEKNGFECIDINECTIDSPCDRNAECTNTDGSFLCQCKLGHLGNGFNCTASTSYYLAFLLTNPRWNAVFSNPQLREELTNYIINTLREITTEIQDSIGGISVLALKPGSVIAVSQLNLTTEAVPEAEALIISSTRNGSFGSEPVNSTSVIVGTPAGSAALIYVPAQKHEKSPSGSRQEPARDLTAARPNCKSRSAPYHTPHGSRRATDRAPDGSLTETGRKIRRTLGVMTPAGVYTEDMPNGRRFKSLIAGDNECQTGTHNCGPNAICSDKYVGFECSCRQGFTGDGIVCTELFTSGTELVGELGEFTSPSYPNYYPDNLRHNWTIRAPDPAQVILLQFTEFHLEGAAYGVCRYDSLSVYDGEFPNEENLLGTFCGSDLPEPQRSTGNVMTLTFQTDEQESFPGFNITFRQMNKVVLDFKLGQFACVNAEGYITSWQRCNQKRDCRDNSDEDNCGLDYRDVLLPNWVGHKSLEEIRSSVELQNLTQYHRQNTPCHEQFVDYVCTLLFPICDSTRLVLPCRSWCVEVQQVCGGQVPGLEETFSACNLFHSSQCYSKATPEGRGHKIGGMSGLEPRASGSESRTLQLRHTTPLCFCLLQDCFYGNGENYQGNRSIGESGERCEPWSDAARLVAPSLLEEQYNWANLQDSYCRNPYSSPEPWCYVKDAGDSLVPDACSVDPCEGACESPVNPKNGRRVPVKGSYRAGDRVSFRCNEGYRVTSGEQDAYCLQNGTWSSPPPECQTDGRLRLIDELFNENFYNPAFPPDSGTVVIFFRAALVDVLELIWNDRRLQWQNSRYSDVDEIRVSEDKLWRPALSLANKASFTASGGTTSAFGRDTLGGGISKQVVDL
ncbi:hypothetical protein Bbelb_415300 [Branchiostoma belcheri]|nr:hypothetical protein Bbelb_415300 [Branchiostoma belcheri]